MSDYRLINSLDKIVKNSQQRFINQAKLAESTRFSPNLKSQSKRKVN